MYPLKVNADVISPFDVFGKNARYCCSGDFVLGFFATEKLREYHLIGLEDPEFISPINQLHSGKLT